MKATGIGVTAAALVLAALPALAGTGILHAGIGGSLSFASDYTRDQQIKRAFRDILDREPSDRELSRYRELMREEDWSESDVRADLRDIRDREDDRYERNRSSSERREDPDRVITRAYQDILDRDPDQAGLRNYRRLMIDEDWTEEDVRKALKKSPEYKEKTTMTMQKAKDIVRRAYLSTLEREPDAGAAGYVDRVMKDKWKEEDVARELRKSAEYKAKHR
jgi:hypothetical protein